MKFKFFSKMAGALYVSLFLLMCPLLAQEGNKPERLEWFQDLGLGLFIHWSVDSQIGSVISHSLVGASDQYMQKYINELPDSFNPTEFDPDEWARLAKLAGMKYVVFTAKHHSGFCMFDTETTDFNIMNTPYSKDITAELVEAFRARGIAIGFYFSPDDFHFLYRQGTTISRRRPEVFPVNNPELMQHDKAQIKELLTKYGPVDIIFIDGPAEGLREWCWELNPDIVVTRGAMETPEISASTGQELPEETSIDPWEACYTMGTSWQWKPTNEQYRSGTDLIEQLIEARAKGGNMLLNIGPKANGEIPAEQEARLREMALWNMVNGEAIYQVRPWVLTNEKNIWFTRSKQNNTVYAIITRPEWEWGEEKTVTLKSVAAGKNSEITVLGQSGKVLEYNPGVTPETTWITGKAGLYVTATRAQRLYNDRTWPNPVVLKITHAEPAEHYK